MATIDFNGIPVDTTGELPEIGAQAPDFELTADDLKPMRLSDFQGKRLVLNIFPSIDTRTCATSARRFNEVVTSLDNTVVVNVSKDLPFAQKRYCAAEGLENVKNASEFKTTSFSDNYHVTMKNGPFEGLFSRAVVVIDENGVVQHTEQVPVISQEPNYKAVVKVLG